MRGPSRVRAGVARERRALRREGGVTKLGRLVKHAELINIVAGGEW